MLTHLNGRSTIATGAFAQSRADIARPPAARGGTVAPDHPDAMG